MNSNSNSRHGLGNGTSSTTGSNPPSPRNKQQDSKAMLRRQTSLTSTNSASNNRNNSGVTGGGGGRNRWYKSFTSIAILLAFTLSGFHSLMSLSRSTQVIDRHFHHHSRMTKHTHHNHAHLLLQQQQQQDHHRRVEGKEHHSDNRHLETTKVDFYLVDKVATKRENNYSGMWWAKTSIVLKIKPEKQITFAGASRGLFSVAKGVAMTVDWLDFCVEHLSKYSKHFKDFRHPYAQDPPTFKRIVDVITAYFGLVQRQMPTVASAPTRDTIAVLPMYEMEVPGQTQDKLLSLLSNPTERERPNVLVMYSLVATLASLWQIGIARVVVVGRTKETPDLMKAAFAIAEYLFETAAKEYRGEIVPMEIAYWGLPEIKKHDGSFNNGVVLIPKLTTIQLQKALRGEMDVENTRALLGTDDPQRWKYVYFSEPDLILHTRPGALEQFRHQLDKGRAISAMRFQVMAHEADFPNYHNPRLLIPSVGHFANFHDLDPDIHSCCDMGNYWPGVDEIEECNKHLRFYQCGFTPKDGPSFTEAEANEAHKRLLKYPMIRLKKDGLGITLIQNHGRVCKPAKRGTCKPGDLTLLK